MLKFELSLEEANLVIQALSELPVRVSLGLINKLQIQAKEQLNEEGKEKQAKGPFDETVKAKRK